MNTKETILITKLSDGQNLVGKKKTSNWKLPPIDFVYGKKEKEDAEGVSRITRSWIVHNQSTQSKQPQDYIAINRLSIKMNAATHATHKDFRKNVDLKRKIPKGTKEKKIFLPSQDFTYGKKNIPSTPINTIINYEYGNAAEAVIKMEYDAFLLEKTKSLENSQKGKVLEKIKSIKKKSINKDEKPLYKLKMFRDVDSKVKQNLNGFKTYNEKKGDLDYLIEKVENELNDLGCEVAA